MGVGNHRQNGVDAIGAHLQRPLTGRQITFSDFFYKSMIRKMSKKLPICTDNGQDDHQRTKTTLAENEGLAWIPGAMGNATMGIARN